MLAWALLPDALAWAATVCSVVVVVLGVVVVVVGDGFGFGLGFGGNVLLVNLGTECHGAEKGQVEGSGPSTCRGCRWGQSA